MGCILDTPEAVLARSECVRCIEMFIIRWIVSLFASNESKPKKPKHRQWRLGDGFEELPQR